MRLLHTIRSVDPAGGGPIEAIRLLGSAHRAQGHTVEIASLDRPEDSWVRTSELPVHALGPGRGTYGYSSAFAPWLRACAGRYDAVIVNGLWQYHGFGAWRGLHRGRTPYFVFPHGMLDPWFKRAYPLKHLKKALYWPWAEFRVLRDARAVCFTCEEERRLARQSFRRYRCVEQVVSLGVRAPGGDPRRQREAFLERFPALRERRLILFLGRLHEKKGCDLLLRAFADVVRAGVADTGHCLVFAGPDQTGWQRRLEQQAAELGVSKRVIWTGPLVGDAKWGALRAAEVFVLPSHQENFGLAVVEALACGVPVLISNQVNIWREVAEDAAGVVADDTQTGTTESLRHWLRLATDERQAMSRRAVACFAQRFDIAVAADQLLKTIREAGTASRMAA